VLRSAAQPWTATATEAPADVQVRHPQFGTLGTLEIIRRNAHEVYYHLKDINRADARRWHRRTTAGLQSGLQFTVAQPSSLGGKPMWPELRRKRPLTPAHPPSQPQLSQIPVSGMIW
jgi:alkyl sulfatase BDS1-like metallo-beta-lactamase superfamily hydrolase